MRDRQTLLEGMGSIKILLQYLYMDENHTIEVKNDIDVPLEISMNEHCVLMCRNLNFPDNPPTKRELDIEELLCIIDQLEETPAVEYPETFKYRWDEIFMITTTNTAINQFNTHQRGGIHFIHHKENLAHIV